MTKTCDKLIIQNVLLSCIVPILCALFMLGCEGPATESAWMPWWQNSQQRKNILRNIATGTILAIQHTHFQEESHSWVFDVDAKKASENKQTYDHGAQLYEHFSSSLEILDESGGTDSGHTITRNQYVYQYPDDPTTRDEYQDCEVYAYKLKAHYKIQENRFLAGTSHMTINMLFSPGRVRDVTAFYEILKGVRTGTFTSSVNHADATFTIQYPFILRYDVNGEGRDPLPQFSGVMKSANYSKHESSTFVSTTVIDEYNYIIGQIKIYSNYNVRLVVAKKKVLFNESEADNEIEGDIMDLKFSFDDFYTIER